AVAGSARTLGPGSRRQDASVEEDLDVRHLGEDSLEIVEQLSTVPGNDHDYPRHGSASSESFPKARDGRRRGLERPKDSRDFMNGIAKAAGWIWREKKELPCKVSTENRKANGSPSLPGLAP